MITTRPELSAAERIQLAYPDEPAWNTVDDATLVALVETYFQEPSCATSAIFELKRRRHPRTAELAAWLLTRDDADQWLKAACRDVLEDLAPATNDP